MNGHDQGVADSTLARGRKEQIYGVLREELRRRRMRRRAARLAGSAAAACLIVGIGAAGVVMLRRAATGPAADGGAGNITARAEPSPAPAASPSSFPLEHAPASRVAVVRTERGIARRLIARPTGRFEVRRISDAELLESLAEAGGERFGLVRAGERVAVVCQTCAVGGGGEGGPEWIEELRRAWTGEAGLRGG